LAWLCRLWSPLRSIAAGDESDVAAVLDER
jgi:hypothetical protein